MPKKKDKFHVIRGEGKTNLARFEKILFLIILLLAFTILLQVGYHWISDWLFSRRMQMEIAEPEVFRTSKETKGIITREEEIVRSPKTGLFFRKASPGKRVPVGEKIGYLASSKGKWNIMDELIDSNPHLYREKYWFEDNRFEDNRFKDNRFNEEKIPFSFSSRFSIFTNTAGVLSYFIDGMEEYSSSEFPYSKINNSTEAFEEGKDTVPTYKFYSVEKGDPLFRIINNWEWYFSVALEKDPGKDIAKQEKVKINFSFSPEREVEAEKIESKEDKEKEKVFITYRIEDELPGFHDIRKTKANIYYKEYSGVTISEEAIIVNKENEKVEKGVYLNHGGIVKFKPIDVLHVKDGRAVIEGVESQSMVIISHDLVEEGQRLE